jgi:hypothetical protein
LPVWRCEVATFGVEPSAPTGIRRDALAEVAAVVRSLDGPERVADIEDILRRCVPRLGYSDSAVLKALGLEGHSVPIGDMAQSGPQTKITTVAGPNAPGHSISSRLLSALLGQEAAPGDEPDDEALWVLVDALPERLATLMSLRYGRSGPAQTLAEIAPHVTLPGTATVSRQRVRQLETKAIRLLRRRAKRQGLIQASQMRTGGDRGRLKAPEGPESATTPTPPPDPAAIPSAESIADWTWSILDVLDEPLTLNLVTHVLLGSRGPATQALIAKRQLPHAGALAGINFKDARQAIVSAVSADVRFTIVQSHPITLTHQGVEKALPPGPANAGTAWSTAADRQLEALWKEGSSLASLAETFGRTRGSITARLVRLGIVDSRDEAIARA